LCGRSAIGRAERQSVFAGFQADRDCSAVGAARRRQRE